MVYFSIIMVVYSSIIIYTIDIKDSSGNHTFTF